MENCEEQKFIKTSLFPKKKLGRKGKNRFSNTETPHRITMRIALFTIVSVKISISK